MKEKYKNLIVFFTNNVKKIVILQSIIVCFCCILEKFIISKTFSLDRFIVLYIVLSFLSFHLLIKPSIIWNFIYKKRYFLSIIVLVICVANKYHFSSISIWNDVVQPNIIVESGEPIWGKENGIRSDEWSVSTSAKLSQAKTDKPYSSINNIIMGGKRLVSLFPMLPYKGIYILGSIFNIGYLFLDTEYAFSFFYISKLLLSLLMSFEFFMIITKGKKFYSFVGMALTVFSPAFMWWDGLTNLIWGQTAIVVFDKFLKSKKIGFKILWSIVFAISGLNYILDLYPAWQVPFGYLFAIIMIYQFSQNKSEIKWKNIFYLIFVLVILMLFLIPLLLENLDIIELTSNTVYPGDRISVGGSGWKLLFNYFSSIFYSFKDVGNPCENSQFLCLFPLPIIMAIYYRLKYKDTKKNGLITALTLLSIFLLIWNFLPLPEILVRFTLLSYSTPERTQVVIGYIMIILIILILSNYESDLKSISNKYSSICVIIISLIVSLGIGITSESLVDYFSIKMLIVSGVLYSIIMLLFMINSKKTNRYLSLILISISIVIGGSICPVTKGLSVIYEKPFAKTVQKIVKEDKDAKWINVNGITLQNYLIANGASTINSTNYYPNLDLWKKIDTKGIYKDIYNRYAHINILIGENESNFELNADVITLNLNYKDICTLDISYITSDLDLKEDYGLTNIYSEEGLNIYKTNCSK